jgi:CBS domain containing-hemolysin-like protein
MSTVCLVAALLLVVLMSFVSSAQLLYLESLRLLKRETRSLQFFRDQAAERIGIETDHGALSFSLIKHISMPLTGVLFFCVVSRPDEPAESVLEAAGLSVAAMLIATYVVPQYLYRRSTGRWLLRAMPLIRLLDLAIRPLTASLRLLQSFFDFRDSPNGEPEKPSDPAEHIEALIDAGAEEGILEEGDRRLIHSVVAFGDKRVREVMTARPNIVAISDDRTLEDLRQLVIHEQFSRIPVFHDSVDSIIGFVHVRDMFELSEEERQRKLVRELMRPIRLVPEMKPVNDLLREMQREGAHMVVVVDEYGNTAGLATMEDLVEEILGEIHDEHEPDGDVREEPDHSFIAPGGLDLDRLEELLGFRPEGDTESTTVGGLVAEWLGHVPRVGESVMRDGIRIEVLAGNELRVEQVRVSRVEEPASV